MKILQVIHQFLPRNVAGSEVYTNHLARELQRRGHDVTVLYAQIDTDRPDFELKSLDYEGLSVLQMVFNYRPANFRETYLSPQAEEVFRGVIKRLRPDVVHFQQLQSFSLGLPRLTQKTAGVIYTLHEYGLLCPLWGQMFKVDRSVCDKPPVEECSECLQGSPYFGPLLNSKPDPGSVSERRHVVSEMVSSVDRFVAPSRFLRDKFVQLGFPREKMVDADYGFPDQETSSPVAPRDVGEKALCFGYAGTLVPHKGIHVLVDGFASISGDHAYRLDIYGDPGKAPEYVDDLKRRFPDERINWLGPFQPARVGEVYQGFDALVVPSIWYENSPLTIHEAFQNGVPVITSDFGGMAELIETGGGLGFEMGNPRDLARVVEDVLTRPNRIQELKAGIPLVKSIEKNATEMEELYEEVLLERKSAGLFGFFRKKRPGRRT